MTTERWQQVKDLFQAAVDVEEKERHAFLVGRAGEDAELIAEVEGLLQRHVPAEGDDETNGDTETAAPGSADDKPTTSVFGEGPGDMVGHYRLLQRIGEGGMGMVYMAEQEEPVRRRVALKIIKPGMDSAQVIARFEAERQALAMMDHPNIARVLDAGTTAGGRPYFVMELVPGERITRYCDRHHLSPRQRLELFVTVCRAVQHAHQKGIIHRDLKPSNILVATCDGKPLPKVIDFGVAKALHQRLTDRTMFTQFGAAVGTPEYMSPEQTENDLLGPDTRSDIYTLGVVLYELLTGCTPLDGKRLRTEGYQKMMQTIRDQEPVRPSTRLSHAAGDAAKIAARRGLGPRRLARFLAGDVDWIVMKALEKEPSRRYESADALARDIERYLTNEPVEASPPSAFYRLGKAVRRHPVAVRRCAAAVAVALCGLGYMWWGWSEKAVLAEWARVEEERQAQIDRAYFAAKNAVMDGNVPEANRALGDLRAQRASRGEVEIIQGAMAVEGERPNDALVPLQKAIMAGSRQPVLAHALLSWAYQNRGQVNEAQVNLAQLAEYQLHLPEEFLLNGWVTIQVDPVGAGHDLTVAMRLYKTPLARLMRSHAWAEAGLDRNNDVWTLEDAFQDLNGAWEDLHRTPEGKFLWARTSMVVNQRAALIYGHLSDPRATQCEDAARACYDDLKLRGQATTQCVDYLVGAGEFGELVGYCGSELRPKYWVESGRSEYWRIYGLYQSGRHAEALAAAKDLLKGADGARKLGDMAFVLAGEAAERQAAKDAAEAWDQAFVYAGSERLEQPMRLVVNEVRLLAGDAERAQETARRMVQKVETWRYREGWYQYLANYQAGLLKEDPLLEHAGRSQISQCEAYFNIGVRRLIDTGDPDRAAKAVRAFDAAEKTHETSTIEWRWSSALARAMREPTATRPTWLPAAPAATAP